MSEYDDPLIQPCPLKNFIFHRSICQSSAPPCVALTALTSAQKMTARWSCWPQTPAARVLKQGNTITIATVAVAALKFLLSPRIPFPPYRASACALEPKKASHIAARPALLLRRSDWSPLAPCRHPRLAPSVPAALCLQAVG